MNFFKAIILINFDSLGHQGQCLGLVFASGKHTPICHGD